MNIRVFKVALALLLFMHVQNVYCKMNILALLPYSGKSHFFFVEVLLEELARRGHNVTVLSHFPKKVPLENYHDIVIDTKKQIGVHAIDMEAVIKNWNIQNFIDLLDIGLEQNCRQGLAHPNVQKLLKSEEHFDLIITEMFIEDCFLGFVHKFGVPHVAVRTSVLSTWLTERTGNPDNPSYVPVGISGNPSRMNFSQRLVNVIYYVTLKMIYWIYDLRCDEIARSHFGEDMPKLRDIAMTTNLYLIDSYFVHQFTKPLMPNVKDVAGLHVKEPKPLTGDLKNWISGASHGLVYLNLGSMIKPASMSEDKKQAFLQAFAQLPQRVLMKWNEENKFPGLPGNVKLTTWAPQNDILHHPNTKLFITHAGMLGTVEAVHAGVPMIAIPFFGDQLTNAVLVEERGLGLVLNYVNISYDTLSSTLNKVLNDPRYATRAKQLSAAFRDRPVPPLEEAVYWIEYVVRHKDTLDVLRSPVLDLPLHQYLLLDVIVVLLIGILIVLSSLYITVKLYMRLISGKEIKVKRQ